MIIHLIIVIAVIFKLSNIVIANCDYLAMLTTVSLIRWSALRLRQGDAPNFSLWPLEFYYLRVLSVLLCCLPSRTPISLSVCALPFSLLISPAVFPPNFFWCAQVLTARTIAISEGVHQFYSLVDYPVRFPSFILYYRRCHLLYFHPSFPEILTFLYSTTKKIILERLCVSL